MSQVSTDYQKSYISTATDTQVFTGPGTLISVILGETAAGAITLGDGLTGAATTFSVLKASIAEGQYDYNCQISTGLTITTAGASKMTVIWKKS